MRRIARGLQISCHSCHLCHWGSDYFYKPYALQPYLRCLVAGLLCQRPVMPFSILMNRLFLRLGNNFSVPDVEARQNR